MYFFPFTYMYVYAFEHAVARVKVRGQRGEVLSYCTVDPKDQTQ